jgi:hypothetical protein
MATIGRHNIAKMYSSTTGTGTLTLTTAVPLCNTFALSGVVTGERLRFVITDPVAGREVSEGIYTAAGLTLTRATVISSTNGGSAIDCSGRQTVAITLPAEDIQPFAAYYGSTGDNITNTSTDTAITIDTEWIDETGLASVAANAVTIAKKGWYKVSMNLIVSGAAAFNGRIEVDASTWMPDVYAKGYTTAMGIQLDTIYIGPVLVNASTDAFSLGTVSAINNLGGTVSVTVSGLTVCKWGNK